MFVVHEQSAVKNSFSTYVCYALDSLFWLNLYHAVILPFEITQQKPIFKKSDKKPDHHEKCAKITLLSQKKRKSYTCKKTADIRHTLFVCGC